MWAFLLRHCKSRTQVFRWFQLSSEGNQLQTKLKKSIAAKDLHLQKQTKMLNRIRCLVRSDLLLILRKIGEDFDSKYYSSNFDQKIGGKIDLCKNSSVKSFRRSKRNQTSKTFLWHSNILIDLIWVWGFFFVSKIEMSPQRTSFWDIRDSNSDSVESYPKSSY